MNAQTLNDNIYLLNNNAKTLNNNATTLRIYKSYILPIIDYGDIMYTNANNFLLTKLQRAQNRCIKICLKVNRRTATDVIHARVRLPKLSDRRLAHQKILAFKRSKQSRYLDQRYLSTRLRDGPVLKVDMLHSEIYKKSVEYSTGVLWNALDVRVRNIDSLHTFKMLVKSELYNTIPIIEEYEIDWLYSSMPSVNFGKLPCKLVIPVAVQLLYEVFVS